mgnify:FL=1
MNNKTTRTTTALEQVVFEYLNELREAGVTNMYGAPLTYSTSLAFLKDWLQI